MSVQTAGKAYLCTVAPTLFNSWALIRLLPFFPTGCRVYAEGAPGSNMRATEVKTEAFLAYPNHSHSPLQRVRRWSDRINWSLGKLVKTVSLRVRSCTFGIRVSFRRNYVSRDTFSVLASSILFAPKFQLIPWTFTDLNPIQHNATQFHVNPQRHINSI